MRRINSPDIEIFHDLRGLPGYNDGDSLDLDRIIYDPKSLRVSIAGSLLRPGKNSIEDIVDGENFFSDFWVTKAYDESEDARYGFFFDLQAYMISRSRFSGLYYDDVIAQELFSGFNAYNDLENNKFLAIAEIISLKMKKRNLDFEGEVSANNLGTATREKTKGPNEQFPEIFVSTPVKLDISLPGSIDCEDREKAYSKYASGNAKMGVHFYHGTDSYDAERKGQIVGRYQYGVDITITDPAAFYVRGCAQSLRHHERVVNKVIAFIINSPPTGNSNFGAGSGLYDYDTHSLRVPLSSIDFIDDRGRPGGHALQMIERAIKTYDDYLLKFRVKRESCFDMLMSLVQGPGRAGLIPISDLEIVGRAISFFARELEHIAASEFLGNSTSENISDKDALERRGTCQRKMPLMEITNYFSETYEYGREYGHGYAYVAGQGGEDMYGLRFISPQEYLIRADSEFNKYFTKKGASPNWTAGTYFDPALQYLSPFLVRAPGTEMDGMVQASYSQRQSTIGRYNLNHYADLLSGLIQMKYDSRYYNAPFAEVQHRGTQSDTQNRKLFNSLVDSLGAHHACVVEEKAPTYFSIPKVQRTIIIGDINYTSPNYNISWPGVAPETQTGPDAFRLIQGAVEDRSILSLDWSVSSSADLLEQARNISEGTDDPVFKFDFPPPPNVSPPIKLTLGILGEMELDNNIRGKQEEDDETYMSALFNSLKNQAKNVTPALTAGNVSNHLNSDLGDFPNQIKSMLVFGLRPENIEDLGENGFDAKRILLEDKNPIDIEIDISAVSPSEFPTFFQTEDPMKIYAKMAAFWMNYKQLGVVEYLDGFERVGTFEGSLYLDPPPPIPNLGLTVDRPEPTLGDPELSSSPIISPGYISDHAADTTSDAFSDFTSAALSDPSITSGYTPSQDSDIAPDQRTTISPDSGLVNLPSATEPNLAGIQNSFPDLPPAEADPYYFRCYGKKLKMPIWRKLTFVKLMKASNNQENVLCRVKTFAQKLPVIGKNGNILGYSQAGLEKSFSEVFDLPIYDQYFVLSKNSPLAFFKGKEKAPQQEQPGAARTPPRDVPDISDWINSVPDRDIPSDLQYSSPENLSSLPGMMEGRNFVPRYGIGGLVDTPNLGGDRQSGLAMGGGRGFDGELGRAAPLAMGGGRGFDGELGRAAPLAMGGGRGFDGELGRAAPLTMGKFRYGGGNGI